MHFIGGFLIFISAVPSGDHDPDGHGSATARDSGATGFGDRSDRPPGQAQGQKPKASGNL